jgi:NAD-dependent SIR2 family protein deacetylase
MSPVDVECTGCHAQFPVSVSEVDERPQACPRCAGEEMLIAALAGRDTGWYWVGESRDAAPPCEA